jgi:hypothetical protein
LAFGVIQTGEVLTVSTSLRETPQDTGVGGFT